MIQEKELYKATGTQIKKIRKAKGYSQSDLAKSVGIERTSITNIESGNQKVTLFVLYKICEVFDIALDGVMPSIKDVQLHEVENSAIGSTIVGTKTFEVYERIKQN